METNVVSFIVENIFLFLPLGIAGIGITIFLFITGKKETPGIEDKIQHVYVTIIDHKINVYIWIYFFIWLMMIIIGLFSDFILPIIVGGFFASIPLILMLLIRYSTMYTKE